jgi:hypothetical protein
MVIVTALLCLSIYTASVHAADFTITPNFQTVVVGTQHEFTITAANSAWNVSLEILSSENYDIMPHIFNFSESLPSFNFTYLPKKSGSIVIATQIDGDDGGMYNPVTVYTSASIRTLDFTGGYANYPVEEPILLVPTNPFNIFLSYFPTNGDLVVTATAYPAGSLVITPSTFTFGATEKREVFNYEALTTGDENGEIIIAYTFSGNDAQYYQSENHTIWPSKRSIVPSSSYTSVAAVKVGEKSQAIRLSVDYPPPTDLTLTPHSEKIVFLPEALQFTPTENTQQFSFVASAPGVHIVWWTLSGTDAALYYDFPNKTNLFVGARPIVVDLISTTESFAVGEASEWVISTQYPPANELTVTFSVADSECTLGAKPTVSPPSITFTPDITEVKFSISSNALCSKVVITGELSGIQKDEYGVPDFSAYTDLKFGKLAVTWNAADPSFSGILRCGDTTQYIVSATTPPPNSFTAVLSGPGATFSPSKLDFDSTHGSHVVSVTANYIQNPITVHFTVSGTDVPLLSPISDKSITVNGKTVTTKAGSTFVTAGSSALYAGTASQQVYIDLSHPPARSVIVTPAANGLVFSPTSLAFSPQDKSLPFTVSGAEPGTYTVTYTLSGDDAGCYTLSLLTTSVTVSKLTVESSSGSPLPSLEIGKWSEYYTLSIENFAGKVTLTPTAYDLNHAKLTVYTFEPVTVTLSGLSPSATFRYKVSEYRPTTDTIVFEVTGDSESIVTPLVLSVGNSLRRSFTLPQYLINYESGSFLPARFVQGRPSPKLVAQVDQAPPNGVSLRPYATNTKFDPAVIAFTSEITTVEFTITTTDGSASGIVKTIQWTVEGADKDLYNTPSGTTYGYVAIKRDLKLSSKNNLVGNSVYVGTPLPFTVVTLYPPSSPLTITPVGEHYTFDPTSVTIIAGATASGVLTITPTEADVSTPIKFLVTGGEADAYETLADTSIFTKKTSFLITSPSVSGSVKLVYGQPSFVFNVRPRTTPPTEVKLKIYSRQVDIDPPELIFTPSITSLDLFVFPLYEAFPIGRSPNVALEFVVDGVDADLYSAPNDITFNALIDNPLRTLVVTPSPIRVSIGKPTTFVVSSTIPPLNSVTITPTTPTDTDFEFTPVSADITEEAPVAKFSVIRKSTALPRQTNTPVVFAISGNDAQLYSDPGTVNIAAQSGTVNFANLDSFNPVSLTVNQKFTTPVVLSQVPVGRFEIHPTVVAGQRIVFDPEEIIFEAGQVATVLSLTPIGVGTSKVAFSFEGEGASSFSFEDDVDFTIAAGTISFVFADGSGWDFNIGGHKKTGYVTLNTPSLNGLEITPSATGLTFEPATIAFASGQLNVPFSVTVSNSSISGYLTTVVGGPDGDAGLFINPYPNPTTQFSVGTPTVAVSVNGYANTYLKRTLTFYLNSPASVLPLRITPQGDGLTFDPPVAEIIDTKTQYVYVNVLSSVAGKFNIFFELSGDGAAHYTVPNLYAAPVVAEFFAYPITVNSPSSVVVGVTSAAFTVTLPTLVTTVEPISVTPKANIAGFDFMPPVVTLNSTITTATFYVRSNVTVGNVVISFDVAGEGAESFVLPISPITYTITQGFFRLPTYDNLLVYPVVANTFIYGVRSQAFVLTARSVPVDVEIELVSDQLEFSPPVLKFTPTSHDVLFSFVPKKVGTATIIYRVLGPNAKLFTAPGPSTVQVTYNVKFPQIPTLSVGITSPGQGVDIEPAPLNTFVLTLSASNFVFNPARLVFAPGQTHNSFTVTALSPTILSSSYNIPGATPGIISDAVTLSVAGRDSSDDTNRNIPLAATVPIIVAPGYFTILHPRYQLDVKTMIKVSISVEPRSDVILTLVGNNLQFHTPQFLVFTRGGPTEQEVEVTPRHTTSYELDYTSFKVDYYVGGTNSDDYLAPSETLHYFAIPMGYIAAIVLVPLALIIIIIIVVVLLRKVGGGGSSTKSVSVN